MASFAPKRILCPIDLSSSSRAVLGWARLFAQAFGATVEVLYAEWAEMPRYFTEEQISRLRSDEMKGLRVIERELHSVAEEVLGPTVPFATSVVTGHAIEVILKRLQTAAPDLVVMGSHGRSGVARLLLGSVAENVSREARCPVLIVRGPVVPAAQTHLNSVLCPVNLTGAARSCAQTAADVAGAMGAQLQVLHAAEEPASEGAVPAAGFCDWIPEDVRKSCHLSEIVVKGNAAEQIILFARREKTDLIVLGAAHRTFLETSTLGSTTVRVMRHSSCPVLLVPHGNEARKQSTETQEGTIPHRAGS